MIRPDSRLLILQANLTMCWDTTFTAFFIPVRDVLTLSQTCMHSTVLAPQSLFITPLSKRLTALI